MGMIVLVGILIALMFSIIIVLGMMWLSVAMIMGEVTWSLMGTAFISYIVVMLVIGLLFA